MGIQYGRDIDKLNLPLSVKERAKYLLWWKGAEEAEKFIENLAPSIVKSKKDALEIIKAMRPGKSDEYYEAWVERLKDLGYVETVKSLESLETATNSEASIEESKKSCSLCGDDNSLKIVCKNCLKDIGEGELKLDLNILEEE